jgi:hypothetical protein
MVDVNDSTALLILLLGACAINFGIGGIIGWARGTAEAGFFLGLIFGPLGWLLTAVMRRGATFTWLSIMLAITGLAVGTATGDRCGLTRQWSFATGQVGFLVCGIILPAVMLRQ